MTPYIVDRISDLTCPVCWKSLAAEESLTAADHASCPQCGRQFAVSEHGCSGVRTTDWSEPPKGLSVTMAPDGFELTAANHSWMVLVVCVVAFAIFYQGMTNRAASPNDLPPWLYVWLLAMLLPVLAVALFKCLGKYVVAVRGDEARVFAGFGTVGWTRRFRWSELSRVAIVRLRRGKGIEQYIDLTCPKRLRFARDLDRDQRAYIAAFLAERTAGDPARRQ
jgi:hypothetical protein